MKLHYNYFISLMIIFITFFSYSFLSEDSLALKNICRDINESNLDSCLDNDNSSLGLKKCNNPSFSDFPDLKISYEKFNNDSLKLNYTSDFFEIFHSENFNKVESFPLATKIRMIADQIKTEFMGRNRSERAILMLNEILSLNFSDSGPTNTRIFDTSDELNRLFCKANRQNEYVIPCFIYKKPRSIIVEYTLKLIKISIPKDTNELPDEALKNRDLIVSSNSYRYSNNVLRNAGYECVEKDDPSPTSKEGYFVINPKNFFIRTKTIFKYHLNETREGVNGTITSNSSMYPMTTTIEREKVFVVTYMDCDVSNNNLTDFNNPVSNNNLTNINNPVSNNFTLHNADALKYAKINNMISKYLKSLKSQ